MSSLTERAGPVHGFERIVSLDQLRGFAVLGILLLNIVGMGLPGWAYVNPTAYGGSEGADFAAWFISRSLFDGSFRMIFSMLFGAGFILFLDRLEARGAGSAATPLFARRALLLVVFGLFDIYVLLWAGDILLAYGVAALGLLPFWKARVRTLVIAALCLLVWQIAWMGIIENRVEQSYENYTAAISLEQEGKTLTPEQEEDIAAWPRSTAFWQFTDEQIDEALRAPEKSWWELSQESRGVVLRNPVGRFFRLQLLDAWLGMFVGMIAFRIGLLSGRWTVKPLVLLTLGSLATGLPIRLWGLFTMLNNDFSALSFLAAQKFYQLDRVLLGLFWTGTALLLLRSVIAAPIRTALEAVGRMALSNYLLQSAIGAVLFLGLGYYGLFSRAELYLVVCGIWTICIVFSLLWLKSFSQGPAEWLWRAGVYRGA